MSKRRHTDDDASKHAHPRNPYSAGLPSKGDLARMHSLYKKKSPAEVWDEELSPTYRPENAWESIFAGGWERGMATHRLRVNKNPNISSKQFDSTYQDPFGDLGPVPF